MIKLNCIIERWNIKMKNVVEKLSKEFETVEDAKKALRSVQSKKCRLAKQKSREDYDVLMTEVLKKEQTLKEVINFLEPKKLFVTEMTEDDIKNLNYEETVRALKSIQSKKCLTQFDDEPEYEKACRIEEMLKSHRDDIKPVDDTVVRKSDIVDMINHFEKLDEKVSTEYVIEQLKKMLE